MALEHPDWRCCGVDLDPNALEVARENIACVLAGKIEMGIMTESEAVGVAQKLLYTNAVGIYALD